MDSSRIFGIGSPKTGTATLGVCLRILNNGKCASWNPGFALSWEGSKFNFNKLLKESKKYVCFHDFPWNFFDLYKKLDVAYPNSKFILTVRDSEKWFNSFLRWTTRPDGKEDMLWRVKKRPACAGQILKNFEEIFKIQYNIDEIGPVLKFKSNIINTYNTRNAEIIEYFKNKQDSLLTVNWENGDGWKELCDFLNYPFPNCAFPHVSHKKKKK